MTTLRAEFTLATGLDAVKVAEPLVPVVKLNPVAEPRAIVPCETDCESESAPAAESVKEETHSRCHPRRRATRFRSTRASRYADRRHRAQSGDRRATLVAADSVSPGSVTETDNESEPE